jgi:hypothetical protein
VLSIVGQHKFYATLSDFLGIIGYWAGNLRGFVDIDQRTDHWHASSNLGVGDLRRTLVFPQGQICAL